MKVSAPSLFVSLALLAAPAALRAADTPFIPATPPSTAPAVVDVGNTKCIVTEEDITPGITLTYEGKLYHLCCKDCLRDFKKDPAKYVKAIESNPAKYGIKPAK